MATEDGPPEEEAIRLALRARDYPQAWALLTDRYEAEVFRFCFYQVRNSADAEEITQQVLLTAGEGLHEFPGGSVRAWLFKLARRFVSRVRGTEMPGTSLRDPPDGVVDPKPPPLETLIATSQRQQLLQALSTLEPQHRAMVILAYGLEISATLPKKEIAHIFNIGRATVYRAINKALQQLRKELKP